MVLVDGDTNSLSLPCPLIHHHHKPTHTHLSLTPTCPSEYRRARRGGASDEDNNGPGEGSLEGLAAVEEVEDESEERLINQPIAVAEPIVADPSLLRMPSLDILGEHEKEAQDPTVPHDHKKVRGRERESCPFSPILFLPSPPRKPFQPA